MKQELKYYKGEQSNPYLEITDKQGAHAMRYNVVAVEFWFFEYHWANGFAKYSKLEERAPDLYYEQHKEPQKEFSTIEDALSQFFYNKYGGRYPFLHNSCARWQKYLYEHGTEERFYKSLYYVLPKEQVPAYLHWYKGESKNPYEYYPSEADKRFWWDFECAWFVATEAPTQAAFTEYLHGWFVRCTDTPWEAIPASSQQKLLECYNAGRLN